MFSRVFGRRKSYETELIDGVEVGRPVIDSASVSGQSFSSRRSSQSSRRSSPELFPELVPVNNDTRKPIRRRPAPLQTSSLGFNENAGFGSEGIWTPVRRSGAVRHQVNPLTRRRQTVSNVDDDIIDSSNDGGGFRSAVSSSNAIRYQQNPLTSTDQSEPPYERGYGDDIVGVDLSSFVPPPLVHHGPGPATPVRRGAIRRDENPLTARRNALQENSVGKGSGSGSGSRHRGPSDFGPPTSFSAGASFPVRRGAVRYSENPLTPRRESYQGILNDKHYQESSSGRLHSSDSGPPPTGGSVGGSFPVRRGSAHHSGKPLTARRNTLQGNGYTPDTPSGLKNNYDPDDLPADEIESLPRLLKSWIDTGMTACDIGRYTVQRLDGRDNFMRGFVTTLVDANTPYTNIGRVIVRHLDIRDDNGYPLHDRLPPGAASLLSSRDHKPQSNHSQRIRTTQNPNLINPTLVCPQPRRNLPPNFANDLGMAWVTDPRSSDEEPDPEDYSPRSSDEYVVLRPGPERKVQIVRPGFATGAQEASVYGTQSRGNSTANAIANAIANTTGPEYPFKGYRYEQPVFRQLVPSSNRRQALEALSEWDGLKGRGPFL